MNLFVVEGFCLVINLFSSLLYSQFDPHILDELIRIRWQLRKLDPVALGRPQHGVEYFIIGVTHDEVPAPVHLRRNTKTLTAVINTKSDRCDEEKQSSPV